MQDEELTHCIIGCAMLVHRTLGSGFSEFVYQQALAHELRKAGLKVECEKKIKVFYDDVIVGDFCADMLVQDSIMIENKAVQKLSPAHEAQLVNYLTATRTEIGLLFELRLRKSRVQAREIAYIAQADRIVF